MKNILHDHTSLLHHHTIIAFVMLTVFALTANDTKAQLTDTTTVPFVAYWSKGDVYHFRITKIKKQFKGDEVAEDDSSSYIARFEVIDSTESSYRISWQFKKDFSSTYKFTPELTKKFEKYSLTEAIYTTDELGSFTGVENWEDLSKIMKGMLKDVVDEIGNDDKGMKKKLQSAMEPLITAYSSKQGIEQNLLKELHYFHFPFGVGFNPAETLTYDEELPNMFGGDPIKANGRIVFDEVDYEISYCVFYQFLDLDPDDTRKLLNDVFKKMGLKSGELKKALKTAKFDVADNNYYSYAFNPGVPMRIEANRQTVIDMSGTNAIRIDRTLIEFMEDEENEDAEVEQADRYR